MYHYYFYDLKPKWISFFPAHILSNTSVNCAQETHLRAPLLRSGPLGSALSTDYRLVCVLSRHGGCGVCLKSFPILHPCSVCVFDYLSIWEQSSRCCILGDESAEVQVLLLGSVSEHCFLPCWDAARLWLVVLQTFECASFIWEAFLFKSSGF